MFDVDNKHISTAIRLKFYYSISSTRIPMHFIRKQLNFFFNSKK